MNYCIIEVILVQAILYLTITVCNPTFTSHILLFSHRYLTLLMPIYLRDVAGRTSLVTHQTS
jgi:hypothetical protein